MNPQDEFYSFLQDYAEFLEDMVKQEQEKLAALVSNELVRIEHSITVQQATAMKFDNMEQKRLKLQAQAGFQGLSFSEIIDQVAVEEQSALQLIFKRIQQALDQIKFYNTKSMNVVRTHINLSKTAADNQVSQAYGYSKDQEATGPWTSLLEKKI